MKIQIESDLLRDTQPARLKSNERRFPLPCPTLKMGLEFVFKLPLFRQPLGFFFFFPSLFHSLFLGQGGVERQAGGLAFWLLDPCDQLGCVCCVLAVCIWSWS